jgi:hypothetical protein
MSVSWRRENGRNGKGRENERKGRPGKGKREERRSHLKLVCESLLSGGSVQEGLFGDSLFPVEKWGRGDG